MCMDSRQQHVKGFLVSGLLAKSECNSDCSELSAPVVAVSFYTKQREKKVVLLYCSFKVFGSGK